MFELIEVDPATGEEGQLFGTGTFDELSLQMAEILDQMSEDYDTEGAQYWPWLMIQPAQ